MPEFVSSGRFAGIPLNLASVANAAQEILLAARSPSPAQFRFVNSYTMALADYDDSYGRLLRDAGTNFVDGRPLHWVLKARGHGATDHARGPAVFEEVLRAGQEVGISHFFYGTNPETLELLVRNVQKRFPAIIVVGAYAPDYGPIGDIEMNRIVAEIQRARPDIVWVALGTPKQDFVVGELVGRTGVTAAAVGAAFDFSAGTKRRAPNWMQQTGLEWAFRLLSEPRRLWRRYLWGNTRFSWLALRELRGDRPVQEAGSS